MFAAGSLDVGRGGRVAGRTLPDSGRQKATAFSAYRLAVISRRLPRPTTCVADARIGLVESFEGLRSD